MRYAIWMIFVLPVLASAQADPFAWLPLRVGSHRIYQHEWKSGDRDYPSVDRWTSDESITAWVTIPEGVVVLRDVKQVTPRNSQARGYLVSRDREPYLVHGSCVYVIGEGWDRQNQRLRAAWQKYLAKGALSADFCFPLQPSGQWGNSDVPWKVEPASAAVPAPIPAEHRGAMHIFSSHFGSGGQEDVWFQKGIGVVGEHYVHSGTYDEYSKKLVSFAP